MKTIKILPLSVLFISSFFANAQNNQSDNLITSGGLSAGFNIPYVGGPSVAPGQTYYGFEAGKSIFAKVSSNNTFIGAQSGYSLVSGRRNTALGYRAGYSNTSGMQNIFIGNEAGYNEAGSDKLYIDNSNISNPLIWGDFAANQLKLNGKVGIGTVTTFPTMAGTVNVSGYSLFVTGGILADEVRVNLSSGGTWADYVFHKDYDLKPLAEVEKFIADNGHLPNVPSAQQVKENGIALGEMAKIQQEKIEELTLYIIELNKKLEAQEKKMQALEAKINN